MPQLKLENVSKWYNDNVCAVQNVSLQIEKEEFVVIVGPSGCGKSTLLRMIAGLEKASSGKIYLDGTCINELPTRDRQIAMVFQNYALYPHMTVYENLAFGLKMRKIPKVEIDKRINEVTKNLKINGLLNRKPQSLSGGQCQRVALARAIIKKTKLFLMDEPLSSLDSTLRLQMRREITNLHNKIKITSIYVTHDQSEAMTMATKLFVMKDGVILQVGPPMNVYEKPNSIFVATFLGSPGMNILRGKLMDDTFMIGKSSIKLPMDKYGYLLEQGYCNKELLLGVRPEHIVQAKDNESNILDIKITHVERLGDVSLIYSFFECQPIVAKMNDFTMKFTLDLDRIHFFDPLTEKRVDSFNDE
ncbi:carbohydrate ABC transporter ATP-binding protein (CUT1 family) [Ureibacillus xyleni]|uniref:Carbohydrate ABC transporter ATP-binding protein (CUT1 family) n=1 Tax=Ureibacillus xyleni TaxID=614648 RepID=A0A285RZ65_9BACL|nr:sn-glycerol-3-phosphate ABC transporter ATP-binding protein UgpC [Ureibacillus xyleni]SOB99757.1 carbohydrate ABC transporter ATP-binding protein (CUT1 family) [Ureibacillus xyleni]